VDKTTGDILIILREYLANKDMVAKAASILRCADAVKFAKYLPPVDESVESIKATKELLSSVEHMSIAKSPTSKPQPS
jgi:hypothetical protein